MPQRYFSCHRHNYLSTMINSQVIAGGMTNDSMLPRARPTLSERLYVQRMTLTRTVSNRFDDVVPNTVSTHLNQPGSLVAGPNALDISFQTEIGQSVGGNLLIDRERRYAGGGQQKSRAVGITNVEIDAIVSPREVSVELEKHGEPFSRN